MFTELYSLTFGWTLIRF